MVSAFVWHVREPRFDPQLGKIIICIFSYPVITYLQSFSRELNCNICLPDNTSSLMEKNLTLDSMGVSEGATGATWSHQ